MGMPRRILAVLLVAIGAGSLLPYLQQVVAISSGLVNLPVDQRATYAVTTTTANQLIRCLGPSGNVSLARDATITGQFRCWSYYDKPVSLQWNEVHDPGDIISNVQTPNSWVTLASSPNLSSACVGITFTSTSSTNNGNNTIVIRGKTADAADFYVELYVSFTARIHQNGGTSFSCPAAP